MLNRHLSLALVSLALRISPASAEDQTAQVWAVFAYTLLGDSIPKVISRANSLTPYGANQLHAAGSAFRDRYVALHADSSMPSTRIESLSPYLLENDDLQIASTSDAAIIASAQAFMQGLYPPLDQSFNDTVLNLNFKLANGSTASSPLGGYQYPQIMTFGLEDPQSIAIAGQALCPAHAFSIVEYIGSKEFWQTYEESAAFYNRLYTLALSGEFDVASANYGNATIISHYLDYQAIHNESLLQNLSPDDVKLARWYAGKYVFATNGNASASDNGMSSDVSTIAGQGLISSILDSFQINVQTQGVNGKMTLLFGSYEPAVALTSLLKLANKQNPNFYSLPNEGASIILELFSLESETYPTYPDPSQLYVRFLLRNGTGAGFRTYSPFGYSPSKTAIPYAEFQAEMQNLSLTSAQAWCLKCNSSAMFCSGVLDTDQNKGYKGSSGISPAVGGVIGAVVTIVVLSLIGIIGFLVYSWRTNALRRSSLGGFKGDRKMASDEDVSFKNPRWGDDVKQADTSDPPNAGFGINARGHERHGSWEMTGQKGSQNNTQPEEQDIGSPFADEIEEEWRLHSTMQPVAAREHV